MRSILRYISLTLLIAINIGCDQWSKNLVRREIAPHEEIGILERHVLVTKVENSGAFLSLGDDWNPWVKTFALQGLPLLALFGILIWLFSAPQSNGMAFGLCCILGGGIGNMIDRIAYGSVTDFIYIQYGLFHTGIFNLADVSITFGALIIIALQILDSIKRPG